MPTLLRAFTFEHLMFQSWSSRISTPTQAGAQQHGSWALFAKLRIELLRRVAAAALLGDFEHLHRRHPQT